MFVVFCHSSFFRQPLQKLVGFVILSIAMMLSEIKKGASGIDNDSQAIGFKGGDLLQNSWTLLQCLVFAYVLEATSFNQIVHA